jgi:UDP-galactopyranose mutase
MEKYLVVGAGFSGATVARLLAESGNDVTVLDRRETVGGNAYDCVDKNGILVQPYGPHIFHTSDKSVFEFLSRFTEWTDYEHKVLARVRKDKLVPVPFNLTSLFSLFPSKAEGIKKILIDEIGYGKKVPILQLKKHENPEIRAFADFVYKNIFYIYTMKQWGFKPEQLGSEVMNRVPVYLSEDDRYFLDTYQYMPKNGFTELITNILRHPNIKIKLKTDVKKEIALIDGKIYYGGREFLGSLIYTGCVDELFDYKYGVLPYRSLKFKFKTLKMPSYQPSAVVNYTTSHKYTRISEFTKFTCEQKENTVIVKEFPIRFKKGKNIPYYPIPIEKNKNHYEKYLSEAKNYKNLYLLGRLATYKYINMDVAVKNAMSLYEELAGDLQD